MPMLTAYALLLGAILAEITGTTFLQKSEQFTRLMPSLAMAAAFALSFYLLSHAIKVIPLGVTYAICRADRPGDLRSADRCGGDAGHRPDRRRGGDAEPVLRQRLALTQGYHATAAGNPAPD